MSDPAEIRQGDSVEVTVKSCQVFGLFCDYNGLDILVRIPDTTWIASYADCGQFASVGDKLRVRIVHHDGHQQTVGSIRALYPENNPWDGSWYIREGEEIDARVVRRVEVADRCGDGPGYLLELRPGACVMLCAENASLNAGQYCRVRVVRVLPERGAVQVELV